MKVEVLGSFGGVGPGKRPTSLFVEDRVVLDAGSVASGLELERQRSIEAVVLTHAHVDHVLELPFLLENCAVVLRPPIKVFGPAETLYALRRHLINNRLWPDFDISALAPRVVDFIEIEAERPFSAGGLEWTPFKVDHTVPTFGYIVSDGSTSFLWSSDTGPTHRLWELLNAREDIGTAMIEVSFDSARQELADRTGHLTPTSLRSELNKCQRDVRVLIHHLKPPCAEQVMAELDDFELLQQGQTYEF